MTFIPKYYLEIFKYLSLSYNNNTLTQDLAGPIGMVKMADQLMLDKLKGILFLFVMIFLQIIKAIPPCVME